jgi:hypothetical protein
VIIPIRPLALTGVQLWQRILNAERRWAARELEAAGLAFPAELENA